MFDDVLNCLLDRVPTRAVAQAENWAVVGLRGQVYPGLIAATGSTAAGLILADLSHAEWQLLDVFENPIYDLAPVQLESGPIAWAYVAPDDEVLNTGWDAALFQADHLRAYVVRCQAWRNWYDQNVS